MTFNFKRHGVGTPLVLLHGLGHRWQTWKPILDILAEHHDVIAVDLPGFGNSAIPRTGMPAGMPETVASLAEFFEGLGLSVPHVAGNSLGGAIALELAGAGLVASATAFSPIGFFTDAERQRSLRRLGLIRAITFQPRPMLRAAMATPALRNSILRQVVAHPERITAEGAFDDAIALRRGQGFRPVVRWVREYRMHGGQPAVPVTIGWGTQDRILPPDQAGRARALLPAARHVALPGCGHVPMSDDPELTARIVLETTGGSGQDPVGRSGETAGRPPS